METKSELVAPCGIYCGICPVYIADKGNIESLKEGIAAAFNVSVGEVWCDGCRSGRVFLTDADCTVKPCVAAKGFDGCYECDEFPCHNIEDRLEPVRRAILRSVPALREVGIEDFPALEEAHYRCPHCGCRLHMAARQCPDCQSAVDLD